ncbi:MAG: cytochrome family [Solirubrobacterales bacterium]|jgi:cytochrome P450|nr:cytochrome family [Solirubrobacterales bacterium]
MLTTGAALTRLRPYDQFAMSAVPAVPLSKPLQTARFVFRPIPFLEHWRAELGETYRANLFGPGDVIFLSDPESIKRLFTADRVNTIAPGRNIVLAPLLGHSSLLLQEDDEHIRRRKLMLPPFHGERMRGYETMITEATERAIADWPLGTEFALHPSMQAITLEVILRAVFGVEDADRRQRLSDALVEILGASASPSALGFATPGVRRLPPFRSIAAMIERTDELMYAEIAEHRRRPDLAERDDILSMLLTARFEDGSEMEDRELRDQLMTLLLAGHETTATGLAWTFDLLLHSPGALERLETELAAGEREYLEAVIEESLRVRPVVPFTGRLLREDTELGGYDLPSGTTILVGIYLAHSRPDLYPEPYEFRPERMLADGAPETYSWIPFGGGTRRCIGAAFAQMEMRIAIETILRSMTLRAATPELEKPVRRNVTLSPANGTRVIASAR